MNSIIYGIHTINIIFGEKETHLNKTSVVKETKNIASNQISTLNKNIKKETDPSIVDPPLYNNFPFGQCTWYVATKRNIPWNGNAINWYQNSIKVGRKVGNYPIKGSIMVTRESVYGHVAYVEEVSKEYFTVSEMNNPIWGVVSKRKIKPGDLPIVGFIY